MQVLATCHSLAQLEDGLVGDPLEKATLTAVDWNLTKGDAVIPRKGKVPGMKIFYRHHFSSALKRMSVIAGYTLPGTTDTNYVITVKGAPETLKSMFSTIPELYDKVYLEMSRRGARVLALGFKELGRLTPQHVRDLTRESLECDLKFAGFVVISCPLKTDSRSVIKEILNASHVVAMITGDNPLTACHVAKELRFNQKSSTLILTELPNEEWVWESIDQSQRLPVLPQKNYKELVAKYDLCLTGEGLTFLMEHHRTFLHQILPHISVFARVAPKQKELVIVALKSLGYTTLMCGDGTNDVGALKHADVGVAIISNAPEKLPEKKKPEKPERERRPQTTNSHGNTRNAANTHSHLQKLLKEIEEQDSSQIVKLGDASIAAPFTSKLSSIIAFHPHSLLFHNYPRPPTATPCCRDCSPASHRDSVLPGQFSFTSHRDSVLPGQFSFTSHRDSVLLGQFLYLPPRLRVARTVPSPPTATSCCQDSALSPSNLDRPFRR
uniref:P-type ATPase n=1 Tax=Timema cristinae TaxID=61476 RepID=A0A7R9D7E6_TIMCR|nr:unnamed protein product [Timema cristinae]